MLILHVNISVKPEYLDAFKQETLENARHSVQEPGIARFDVVQNSADPCNFALWEVYRTQDAVAAHKLTPHYAKWTANVDVMMAEPRGRTWYSSLFPDDESW